MRDIGNHEDRTYSGHVTNSLEIRGTATITGLVTAPATIVHSGGALYLSGMIDGDLIIQQGAEAHISGMVTGLVHNEGDINVTGLVERLVTGRCGRTTIKTTSAVVRDSAPSLSLFRDLKKGGWVLFVGPDYPSDGPAKTSVEDSSAFN